MSYAFIAQDCPDLPVATCCRVMKVSTSGFYAWLARPVSQRDWDDGYLTNAIVDIHRISRGSYGSPRCTPSCAWATAFVVAASGWNASSAKPASPAPAGAAGGVAPAAIPTPHRLRTS